MSLLSSGLARSHGALLSRLLWPTALLFVVTILTVAMTFLWTSRHANEVAAATQRARLASALNQRLESLRDDLASFIAEGIASSRALPNEAGPTSNRGTSLRRLDGALVLSAAGSREILRDESGSSERVLALFADVRALRRGEPDDAAYRDVPVTAEIVRQSMAPQILSDGTGLYAVVSATGRDVGATFVPFLPGREMLIAWKRLDGPILARIAEIHGLAALSLAPVSRDGPSTGLALENGRGETVAEISWVPDRPGDLMQQRISPIVGVGLGFSALMFGAVALHFHRTTKNLAETDAIAKDLLGRDPLSGLANRMLFNERLDRELANVRDGAPGLAVVFIDLDRFKDVNDSYGHQAGDDLIQLVARRILDILPDRDTLARLGGDEFAIIQTQLASFEQAEALCRRILDLLTRPFAVAHTQVTIGASIGVALAPEHARTRESLMKLADTALYQAKSEGRNRVCFFQTHMDETLRMRKVVEDDLRKAITGDQLILHYQPLFSSDGEKIVGLEALVRWPHPERGLISPSEFIAIAEERGLVIPLGEWVLRRACEDGKRWPNLRVAVNVSAIQFRHRGFVESVTRALEETGFDASRLELELTEGVVVGDEDAAEAAMIELRALGVHLALDDFGTGYSSLIYLRRFAFDKIKIDRSFLESMEATGESAILVHSIVHLGRALGLVVTAEGVETKEQHRFLQALGCHQLQGYLFSRPVAREEIDRMVAGQVSAAASAA